MPTQRSLFRRGVRFVIFGVHLAEGRAILSPVGLGPVRKASMPAGAGRKGPFV